MTAFGDPLLVLRAQSGDREALDALLASCQTPLFACILRLNGDRRLAEDVLQEVFLRIYRKLPWLNDPALFRAWAYRIATREAFKALRRERRWSSEEVPETAAPPEASHALTREELAAHVGRLSPASRAVIVLHFFDDLPLADVAAILGLALGTVKSRLAYGLKRLREEVRA